MDYKIDTSQDGLMKLEGSNWTAKVYKFTYPVKVVIERSGVVYEGSIKEHDMGECLRTVKSIVEMDFDTFVKIAE